MCSQSWSFGIRCRLKYKTSKSLQEHRLVQLNSNVNAYKSSLCMPSSLMTLRMEYILFHNIISTSAAMLEIIPPQGLCHPWFLELACSTSCKITFKMNANSHPSEIFVRSSRLQYFLLQKMIARTQDCTKGAWKKHVSTQERSTTCFTHLIHIFQGIVILFLCLQHSSWPEVLLNKCSILPAAV